MLTVGSLPHLSLRRQAPYSKRHIYERLEFQVNGTLVQLGLRLRKGRPRPAYRISAERGRSTALWLANELLKTTHFSRWILM
jgi:hypothetical protein